MSTALPTPTVTRAPLVMAIIVAAAVAIQWVLAWAAPNHPASWLPGVIGVSFAAAYAYFSVSRLQRIASTLFMAGAAVIASPNVVLRIGLQGAFGEFVLDNSPYGGLALLMAGCFLVAVDIQQRQGGKAILAILIGLAVIPAFFVLAGRDGAKASGGPSQTATARDVEVSSSPGALVNSNVYGDLSINVQEPIVRGQLAPPNVDPPSYRDVASALLQLQRANGWDDARLSSELIKPPTYPKDRVTLRVRNLTGTTFQFTLVDAKACVGADGILDRSPLPLDHSNVHENEAWATLFTFPVHPDDGMAGHLNLVTNEFDQFYDPSGWFVIFADYEKVPGGDLDRIALGAFNLFTSSDPVLRIVAQEASAETGSFHAELEP